MKGVQKMGVFKHFLAICLAVAVLLSLPVSAFAAKIPPVRIEEMESEIITLPEGGLKDVQSKYLEIVKTVQSENKEDDAACRISGSLHDLNQDGLPELFLEYVKNTGYQSGPSVGIYGTIVIPTDDNHIQKITLGFGDVTCGECGIYWGMLDKEPVLHCIYAYSTQGGPPIYGWDSVYRFGKSGLEPFKNLNWSENTNKQEFHYYVDGSENEREWQKIMDSVEETVLMDYAGNNIEELKYQIANYVL